MARLVDVRLGSNGNGIGGHIDEAGLPISSYTYARNVFILTVGAGFFPAGFPAGLKKGMIFC